VEVQGRVALVTGAGSGIGRATAFRLAHEGAAVVVDDIDEEGGQETVQEIKLVGGRAAFVRADVSNDADVRTMVTFAEETFGGLDILVNNAGIVISPSFPAAEPNRWGRVLDVNLRGVMLGTHYAIPAMGRRGGGSIVNISSGAGIGYQPRSDPEYAASKAGVVRFTAALAPLQGQMNIRVNCICPGWVGTPMVQRVHGSLSREEWEAIAPPVMLQPQDIADAVVELIRDDGLAGRIMLCYEGEPRRLVPNETEV
jgi:NAD(P)-dependent dehydrogenase (short-subunit alcohol dehydrogenase family)